MQQLEEDADRDMSELEAARQVMPTIQELVDDGWGGIFEMWNIFN